MTKEELVLRITRAMYNDCRILESFNAYQAIKGYFLDLEMADLIGIASQYGIKMPQFQGIESPLIKFYTSVLNSY